MMSNSEPFIKRTVSGYGTGNSSSFALSFLCQYPPFHSPPSLPFVSHSPPFSPISCRFLGSAVQRVHRNRRFRPSQDSQVKYPLGSSSLRGSARYDAHIGEVHDGPKFLSECVAQFYVRSLSCVVEICGRQTWGITVLLFSSRSIGRRLIISSGVTSTAERRRHRRIHFQRRQP